MVTFTPEFSSKKDKLPGADDTVVNGYTSYTFNFTNNSTQTVNYSVPGPSEGQITSPSGASQGSIPPQGTATYSFVAFSSSLTGEQDNDMNLIQEGSWPLLSTQSGTLNVEFSSGYDSALAAEAQYINIIEENGVTVTENTSIQNNGTGGGLNVGIGGGGGSCKTNNICIQISDS